MVTLIAMESAPSINNTGDVKGARRHLELEYPPPPTKRSSPTKGHVGPGHPPNPDHPPDQYRTPPDQGSSGWRRHRRSSTADQLATL